MRAACRKFLNTVGSNTSRHDIGRNFGAAGWVFNTALGELRGIIGLHVAAIATKHGLDVEDELASIFPIKDSDKTA
jgi:hypothetical protein